MIYTLTLNPCLDYAVELKDFKRNAVNRTEREYIFPGGKGINVAVVLHNLEVPVTAMGFQAGLTGAALLEMLRAMDVPVDFVAAEGSTRINVKIIGGEETQINGRGAVITEDAFGRLLSKVSLLPEGSILTVGGALPQGLNDDAYAVILERAAKRGVRTVLDAEGEPLRAALSCKPFLAKVNKLEAEGLLSREISSQEDAARAAAEIRALGAENVALTLGGTGSLMASSQGTFFVRPPKGKVVNAVGSGDSFVAGFLAGYVKGENLYDAFLTGAAAGSATAYKAGLATKEEIEELISRF